MDNSQIDSQQPTNSHFPSHSIPRISVTTTSISQEMGRRSIEPQPSRFPSLTIFLAGFFSFAAVYTVLSIVLNPNNNPAAPFHGSSAVLHSQSDDGGSCCRGIEKLELWGAAVKWGSEFKFNSSEECCRACKSMCSGNQGPCLCDTWVFCGDKEACGPKFGECWLKKQKDVLDPERQGAGETTMWSSGLVFGRGEGIVGLETAYGTLHIKLFPDCAPHSVAYILELLTLRHCAGCQFYRAEGRGDSWDSQGNHISNSAYGPPFALVQGILEAQGTPFKRMEKEACPTVQRGSVAWVGSGPEFFISLAHHPEWKHEYTVFGSVMPEDMEIAEKIAQLPTKPDVWNNINVSVLEKSVPLMFKRSKIKHQGDL